MIKLFRKIRYKFMETGKRGRYLKYAIGEILLVVIGILIALQINNANEAYKAKQSEQVVLKNIVQDLKADLILLAKTAEFPQLLLEASIKSKSTGANYETVLTQNQKLKELIQKELKQ